VGILAVVSCTVASPAARMLTDRDTIVLADFDNATDDRCSTARSRSRLYDV
jgi:hypothetical protein